MNGLRKSIRSMAVLLSLACAVTVSGCQRENNPSGGLVSESMEVSSLVLDSEVGSQTSSEEPPVTSAEESQSSSAVSSMVSTSTTQADPSSISEDAPSQVESSQSDSSTLESAMIPFVLSEYRDVGGGGYWYGTDSHAQIIIDREDYRDKIGQGSLNERYNDAYFETRALVYVMLYHLSCSSRDRVNTITRSNQRLTIDYTTFTPMIYETAGGCFRVLLEVSKSDIDGITTIDLKQHEAQWEEATNPWELQE